MNNFNTVIFVIITCILCCDSRSESKRKSSFPKIVRNYSIPSCQSLSPLQYKCARMEIDKSTQMPVNCQPDNSVIVRCKVNHYLECEGLDDDDTFEKKMLNACQYDAHVQFSTALLLSIFLGMFGIDRIYLGYYAIGLFKMFSLGGLFILWLADVVLIGLQLLTPADGTAYRMPYYGPRVTPLRFEPSLTNYSIYSCENCT